MKKSDIKNLVLSSFILGWLACGMLPRVFESAWEIMTSNKTVGGYDLFISLGVAIGAWLAINVWKQWGKIENYCES